MVSKKYFEKSFDGIITELVGYKEMFPKDKEEAAWNAALDEAIRLCREYQAGCGLLQLYLNPNGEESEIPLGCG